MAKLEITVSRKGSGLLIAHETFEISRELAQEFIAKMEASIAELPGQHRTSRTVRPDGATVAEIEFDRDVSPPMVRPNFEELFRQRRGNDPR
jgi:hypothetical protein